MRSMILAAGLVASSFASANVISCGYTDTVQLNAVYESGTVKGTTIGGNLLLANTVDDQNQPATIYNSYACGGYSGNDKPNANDNYNYGLRNDGFMNMDEVTLSLLNGNNAENYDFNQIFNNPDSEPEELQILGNNFEIVNGNVKAPDSEVDGDTNLRDDPGWIQLGRQDDYISGSWDGSDYASVRGNSLEDFISISFTADGLWSLGVKGDSIGDLEGEDYLDRFATFDHLAIVLKAGNNNDNSDDTDGFFVFDFDFKDIFKDQLLRGNVALGYRQEYTFTGTWNTDMLEGKGLSHAAVWVRDPIVATSEEVPAPSVLGLLGLSLLGIAVRRRKRNGSKV